MSALGEGGSKLKEYAPVLIAVVLVVVALYVYSKQGATQSSTLIPGTNNDAAVAQVAAANASQTAQFNSGIFSAFGGLTQLAATENTNAAGVAINATNNATDLAKSKAQDSAAYLIAQQQAAVQTVQSNNQLQASQAQAHASQQNGFWGSLSSIFSTAAPLLLA